MRYMRCVSSTAVCTTCKKRNTCLKFLETNTSVMSAVATTIHLLRDHCCTRSSIPAKGEKSARRTISEVVALVWRRQILHVLKMRGAAGMTALHSAVRERQELEKFSVFLVKTVTSISF
ncbi:hypothetical protein TRVL_08288 [Trypanosoma vivax]|nr:hypothetical protein TRVL_08288 [Trypanosoma vivax]